MAESTRGNSSAQIKDTEEPNKGHLWCNLISENQTSFISENENQLGRPMDTLFHVPQLQASLWKKVWHTTLVNMPPCLHYLYLYTQSIRK